MIVFTMAGESRRFSEAGYGVPKYMLPIGNSNCFACAVAGFRSVFGKMPFLFVMRDVQGTEQFVKEQTHALGIPDARFVVLGAPTSGQATTAELGLIEGGVEPDRPITIFNIDTFRFGFEPPASGERGDGYLEVFVGSGDNWSFVAPGGGNKVLRTTEKEPISDLCSTGLYNFARAGDFLWALAQERIAPSSAKKELYVAPVYNQLIRRGADIRYQTVPRENIVFCGVPAEYEAIRADADLSARLEKTARAA